MLTANNSNWKPLFIISLRVIMRSYFQNSCFVFHRGIQTPRAFICFLVFGDPVETFALVLEKVLQTTRSSGIYHFCRFPVKQ